MLGLGLVGLRLVRVRFSAASLRLYVETAARKVQAGKARDSRRPVHEGITWVGLGLGLGLANPNPTPDP